MRCSYDLYLFKMVDFCKNVDLIILITDDICNNFEVLVFNGGYLVAIATGSITLKVVFIYLP